jgi:EpsI family protein
MMPRLAPPQLAALAALAVSAWGLRAGMPANAARHAPRAAHPAAAAPSDAVPPSLGLWTGRPLQADRRATEILETEDVTLMEYQMGQEPPVWLARVAGFGNRAAFHPPELCYIGSHFEILTREPVTVFANGEQHRLMRLVVAQDGRRYESWYWFTANGRVTPSYYRQQLWLVLDAIRRQPGSGTLVRISTSLDEPEAARRRLLAFWTSLDATSRFARPQAGRS